MAEIRTFRLPHLPTDLAIHVALYEDLQNSRFLRKQLLDGNTDFEFAFIDARMIAESFRRFGISDQTRKLLVIKLASADGADDIKRQLEGAVEAKPLQFGDVELSRLAEVADIKKIYKLNQPLSAGMGTDRDGGDQTSDKDEQKELEAAILGVMALRGAT